MANQEPGNSTKLGLPAGRSKRAGRGVTPTPLATNTSRARLVARLLSRDGAPPRRRKPVRLPHLSPRSGSSPCRRWHRKGHLEPSRTSGTTLTKLLCVGGDTSNQKYSEVGKDDKRGSNSERKRERQNHPLICTYCFAKKLESTEPVPRGGP